MDPNFANEPLENYSNGPRPMVTFGMVAAMAHINRRHRKMAAAFQAVIDDSTMPIGRLSDLVTDHNRTCRDNVVIRL